MLVISTMQLEEPFSQSTSPALRFTNAYSFPQLSVRDGQKAVLVLVKGNLGDALATAPEARSTRYPHGSQRVPHTLTDTGRTECVHMLRTLREPKPRTAHGSVGDTLWTLSPSAQLNGLLLQRSRCEISTRINWSS